MIFAIFARGGLWRALRAAAEATGAEPHPKAVSIGTTAPAEINPISTLEPLKLRVSKKGIRLESPRAHDNDFSPIRLCLRGPNLFLQENCCNVRGYSSDPRVPRAVSRRPWLILNENALRSGLGFLRKAYKIQEKRDKSRKWKVKTCFVTKSVRFGRTELSI